MQTTTEQRTSNRDRAVQIHDDTRRESPAEASDSRIQLLEEQLKDLQTNIRSNEVNRERMDYQRRRGTNRGRWNNGPDDRRHPRHEANQMQWNERGNWRPYNEDQWNHHNAPNPQGGNTRDSREQQNYGGGP